ncbi:MAG: prolipoprotein diacylglyceryl transferase [Actinomycetaceae bacterium]|nr:prolipoprotein diacylglyceryl transferase [Actinomycetaceae bacterium]
MLHDLAVNAGTVFASIPSPPQHTWYLGPLAIRAYGILIGIGMIVAVLITQKRYRERGGNPDLVFDVAMAAIPTGIIGARLYHVFTSPQGYFPPNGDPTEIVKIWHGGLGIWGGIAAGALGGWLMLRHRGQRVGPFVDSVAPALLVAQAIGRLGNWFNQELFGGATNLPWGLQIDDAHLPAGYASGTLFHPTFLYELLWNLGAAALIIVLDRKRRFHGGQLMWLYIMAYTAGRIWIENVRIDTATMVLGLRINVWIMSLTFLFALVGFYLAGKRAADTTVTAEEAVQQGSSSHDDASGEDGVPVGAPGDIPAVLPDEKEGKNVE